MRVVLLIALVTLSAAPVRAAQSFVYVVVAAPPCTAGPCASRQLRVYDSVTKELVIAAQGHRQPVFHRHQSVTKTVDFP